MGEIQALLVRYEREAAEWQTIRDELIARNRGEPVTAYEVSLEQRKRALARGKPLLSAAEIAKLLEG